MALVQHLPSPRRLQLLMLPSDRWGWITPRTTWNAAWKLGLPNRMGGHSRYDDCNSDNWRSFSFRMFSFNEAVVIDVICLAFSYYWTQFSSSFNCYQLHIIDFILDPYITSTSGLSPCLCPGKLERSTSVKSVDDSEGTIKMTKLVNSIQLVQRS